VLAAEAANPPLLLAAAAAKPPLLPVVVLTGPAATFKVVDEARPYLLRIK
jgi:hypothetical protein